VIGKEALISKLGSISRLIKKAMSDDDKVSTFLIQIENTQVNTQDTGKLMFYSSSLNFDLNSRK
jgi:hypothetical protein